MKSKHIYLLAATLLAIFACTKGNIEENLSVYPDALVFDLSASRAKSIIVEAGAQWESRSDATWITLSTGEDGKTLKVQAQPNTAGEGKIAQQRSAVIIVSAGGKSVEVKVTQEGESAVFTALGSPSPAEFSCDGGKIVVTIEHNVDYQITSPDWIRQADTKTVATDNLTFTVAPNESTQARTASLEFTPSIGNKTSITVKQDGFRLSVINNADDFLTWIKDPGQDVSLGADIDMAGKTVTGITLPGSFDGKGHTISNLALTAPLFTSVTGTFKDVTFSKGQFSCGVIGDIKKDATVSGITFDKDCTLEYPVPTGACSYGLLAANNAGTVENCTTAVSYDQKFASLPKASVCFGGLVGYSEGLVKKCTNTGRFAIDIAAPTSGTFHWFGGIVGKVKGEKGVVLVQECENKASIQLRYATAVYFFTGGVVGGTELISVKQTEAGNYGIIDGCVNRGSVNQYYTNGGSGAYPNTAGVIGYCEGYVQNCDNYGDITLECKSDENWTGMRVAGVAGICAWGMKNCANYGGIYIDSSVAGATKGNRGAGSHSRSCFAGVCAMGGPFITPTNDILFEDCTNESSYTMSPRTKSGGAESYYGGVFGYLTAAMKGCQNSGNVGVSTPSFGIYAGGIAGGSVSSIYNCSNNGSFNIDMCKCTYSKGGWKAFVGGICGEYTATSPATVSGCTNSGNVTLDATDGLPSASKSYICGIIGQKSTAAVTLSDCANYGKLEIRNSIINADSDDLFCPKEEKPVDPSNYFAEGHVTEDNGAACQGIKVTDGFRSTVTDKDGYYKLTTTADTRYISFTLPAWAKIVKNEHGCPDFFKKYTPATTTTYDFKITRQGIENDFALFVLGDPQAHYQIKGTQFESGTDRFLHESVPAINGQIAIQTLPCYGVTMGDIVYSDGTYNSNPGMPIMRESISKLNMPVFQTFGNHDITFYKKDDPISTDAHSSTINLVSQRAFEDCFGPVDLSFDRGNVHIVCMKNIHTYCTTTWNPSNYNGAFTDDQLQWLKDDLANVPKTKKVIFCCHVPISSSLSNKNVRAVLGLINEYTNSTIFSGHTHTNIGHLNVGGTNIYEHTHNAVCGSFWYANHCGDGTPSGFTVYNVSGTTFTDDYFIGVNKGQNTRDCQIRMFQGNLKCGGEHNWFQLQRSANDIFINVFNADARWKVHAYENGVDSGELPLMATHSYEFSPNTETTYKIPADSNQDWWVIGFLNGVLGRNYCYDCYHMYMYTMKDPSAKLEVKATDPYGHVYTCDEIIRDGLNYPEYMTHIGWR